MKMRCRECGREMDLWEFATYIEAYFIKLAIVSGAAAFLAEAVKHSFLTQTRGAIDSTIAGLANNFAIKCPKCKKVDTWDPAPEKVIKPVSKKDRKTLSN